MEIKMKHLFIMLVAALFLLGCKNTQKQESKNETISESEISVADLISDEEEEYLCVMTVPDEPVSMKFVPPVISPDKEYLTSGIICAEEYMKEADLAKSTTNNCEVIKQPVQNKEEYPVFIENKFLLATSNPLSTFSIDVDAASYSNIRRMINQGTMPNSDAVRVEEMINYFDYQYPQPQQNDPVFISAEIGESPWNKENKLVKIGLKAKEIPTEKLPNSNFVFLIDISGSMSGPTRLDLVKSSLKMLLDNLRPDDRVAIVTYANGVNIRLNSTSVKEKSKIKNIINELYASGGTSGGDGIVKAYQVAEQNFMKEGNNRIILCTDGDFNIGMSNDDELEKLIEKKRKSGVFLSVLGYGMGNYKDRKMQKLAQAGNGNHAYIDNLQEAYKVLVKEFSGTMHTLAKDVKLQIEFNPDLVQAYRLVGYETRALNKEDFNDDTKDAGELGVGHTVTAFYELVPVGVKSNLIPSVDPLKYQNNENRNTSRKNNSDELITIKLRYKDTDSDSSKLMSTVLTDPKEYKVSQDFKFASAVAMFGQLLRESQYKGEANYDKVISLARQGLDHDPDGYRREFIRLVETVKKM